MTFRCWCWRRRVRASEPPRLAFMLCRVVRLNPSKSVMGTKLVGIFWHVGRTKVERFTCRTLETWILRPRPSWFAKSLPVVGKCVGHLVSSAERHGNWKPKSKRENSAKIFTTESVVFVYDCPRC